MPEQVKKENTYISMIKDCEDMVSAISLKTQFIQNSSEVLESCEKGRTYTVLESKLDELRSNLSRLNNSIVA